jgi:hypothetical protein
MGIRRNKTLMEQATDYVEAAVGAAVEKAGPVLSDAKDKAGPILADASDRAGSAFSDARDQAGPAFADAKAKAAPLIAAGAALAAEKASAAAGLAAEKAAEGKELAAAKAAELKGEPKKKHRFRKFLIFSGIVAALGFVASKLRSNADKENWQSSYTPPPPPARASDTPIADAAAAASVDEAADEGGAGPDEALADSVEQAHPVTTPDDPADVVELAPSEETAEKGSTKS